MAWFADWHPNYGVSNIPWAGYTHMAFFTQVPSHFFILIFTLPYSAQPSSDGTIEVIISDPTMVDEFTAAAVTNVSFLSSSINFRLTIIFRM